MAKNTFGQNFCVTTFGESHAAAMGVVIDGCPAGVTFDQKFLIRCLERRRPGFNQVVSQRKEADCPEVLSGVFEGKTLGTPIAMIVRNLDQRSKDYEEIKKNPRPGHADDVWKSKFHHVDHRGGGRSSGRETVSRVMAGAVAEMWLRSVLKEYSIVAYANKIGPIELGPTEQGYAVSGLSRDQIDGYVARFPSESKQQELESLLLQAREDGKSYGGEVQLEIRGIPAGLGQPVFHKLKADLASAVMSIGATSAVEIGEGFSAADREGTEFHSTNGAEGSSVYGGIRGGISTGKSICIKVSFKPTSSVLHVSKKGRHDPCIVPRAIPVLESMAAIVIADHLLWCRSDLL